MIGDVTGHDIAAAGAMGQVRNALRAWALDGQSPAVVLARINALLFAFDAQHYATCAYLTVAATDEGPVQLVLGNAGHCPPLLVPASGAPRWLENAPACPLLGAAPDFTYRDQTYWAQPGDTLLLYTDGLVERRGEDLDDSLDRLCRAAAHAVTGREPTPGQLCNALLHALFAETIPDDDVVLLAITFTPTATTTALPQAATTRSNKAAAPGSGPLVRPPAHPPGSRRAGA